MFNDLMVHLSTWQWFFASGIILMFLELCLPAFFLLWIGFACLLTAGTLLLHAFDGFGQVCFFSLYCILSIIVGYSYYQRKSIFMVTSGLNNREGQLIGKIFILDQPLSMTHNGKSTKIYISINDTRWEIQSAHDIDIDINTKARVTAIKGNVLLVEGV